MTLDSQELARLSRVSCVTMCGTSGSSHVGSSLSVIDIMAVLYTGIANVTPSTLKDLDRDYVIVSKGHAASATYAILAHAGFFSAEWLASYCQNGAPLGGHVSQAGIPGVEVSTGSLGHGLPFGTGVAWGKAARFRQGHVFVVMSDGEQDEGSTWEAALFAAHHKLANLTVIIDRNGLQSLGATESTLRLEPLGDKWTSFGWRTYEVDGHDHTSLAQVIREAKKCQVPTVVIANTVKGKGVSFFENTVLSHYQSPTIQQIEAAVIEINGRNRA